MKVSYAPLNVNHLLVVTANNKLLKFEARTGRILTEVTKILPRILKIGIKFMYDAMEGKITSYVGLGIYDLLIFKNNNSCVLLN